MKKRFLTWFTVSWAVVLSIQSMRAVLWAFDEPRIGWKLAWFGVAAFYALVAYGGGGRFYFFLRVSKKNNRRIILTPPTKPPLLFFLYIPLFYGNPAEG